MTYKVISASQSNLEEILNTWTGKGWELVTIVNVYQGVVQAVFRKAA